MNQEKIGSFIAKCRKERNLTQSELAEKLGVSEKSISNWENGRNMPDLSLFKPLCDELNISINELISGEKIKKEKYQEKLEENIINTINYSNNQVTKKNNLVGIILIIFGIIISIYSMITFKNESNFGNLFICLGGVISLIGITNFTKKFNYLKRLFCNFICFIIFILLLLFLDYLTVINIKKPPRFCIEKISYEDMIIYKMPFYNVFRMNANTLNEYYVIDTKKEYDKETIPKTPFNREKSGIDNIIKYKNKNLNNKSNTENLISNLPLSEHQFSIEMDKENTGLIINYDITDWNYNTNYYLNKSLLYNAISIFALIDNVEYIDFYISLPYDKDFYHIKREYVENLYPEYKYIVQNNIDKNNFNRYVEEQINSYEFIIYNFKSLFIDANLKDAKKIEVLGYKEKITEDSTGEEESTFEKVVIKTFNEEPSLNKVIDIFTYYNRLEENALVTMEGESWTLFIYDESDKLTCTLSVWQSGIFGINSKRYSIAYEDEEIFKNLFK